MNKDSKSLLDLKRTKCQFFRVQTFHQQLAACVFFLLKVSPDFLSQINALCLNLHSRNNKDISEVTASQLSGSSFLSSTGFFVLGQVKAEKPHTVLSVRFSLNVLIMQTAKTCN